MPDYTEEKQLRVALFERWLKLMVERRGDERSLDCAIVFTEDPPDGCDKPQLEESRALPLPAVLAIQQDAGLGGANFLEQDIIRVPIPQGPEGGGKGSDDSHRYVQFAFLKQTFYMELPKNALWPDEVRQLMAQRSGFFYLRNGRLASMSFEYWQKLVREWNPVLKQYLNSDTRTAAEDMAFILFDLLRFPLDWQFYRHTMVFNRRKKRDWEGRGPVT